MKIKSIDIHNTARSDVYIVVVNHRKWSWPDFTFVFVSTAYYYCTRLLENDSVPPFMPTKDSLKEGFSTIYHHEQPTLYKALLSHVMAYILEQTT